MNNPPKILIAEDNEPTRNLLKAYAEKANYQVVTVQDGEEALEKLNSERPDLILLDLQMEPVGGLRFMRRMIGTEYEVPAILITGDPSIDILNQANKLGIAGVLRKPIDEKQLMVTIARVLAKQ